MENIGVYICSGCNIGECVDLSKVEKVANEEYSAKVCRQHQFLCGKEGVELIKKDIADNSLDSVVVAACSPRVMQDVFDFGSDMVVERANMREQVAWCHEPNDEDTDMLAEDTMRMSMVKTQKILPIEPFIGEDLARVVMVVGGGMTGIIAALAAADSGYETVLVEKEGFLGGWAKNLKMEIPTSMPYTDLQEVGLDDLLEKVNNHSNIKVYLNSTVGNISGGPCMFEVTLENDNKDAFRVASIVLATGARPYDAGKLTHLGFGQSADVITAADFEKMAKEGKFFKPSDGSQAKSVAFIQCAGSRDGEHLPYCSAECCLNSLKQAKYLRQADEDSQAYIIYKDMRTPAQYELFYKAMQDDMGIFLTKGEINSVKAIEGGDVKVEIDDKLLGDTVELHVDLLVLATGMVPTTLEDEVLNLTYRQGKELPTVKEYGFPDSEFICFPYETRRTGIYAAGSVRQPMDAGLAREDALGAALKAIQCIELTSKGAAVHPRALDFSYPEFFLQRCTQCKRCTEECPFGALDEDEKGTPEPHPERCRRCGVCMGACPERIVSFKNYSVDMIANVIKSVEVPEEDEEKPRVLALVCENDAYPAFDMLGTNRVKYSPYLRIIPVRCLGSVNTVWVSNALDNGFDGILYIGCKHGDDYQCHFIKGSELAEQRMENVSEKLTQMMLEQERVEQHEVAINEYDKLAGILEEYMETIEDIGPNPFKDM